MKTLFHMILLFTTAALLACPPLLAAAIDPGSTIIADPTTVIPVETQNAVLALFLKLALAHPWIATVAAFMAMCRLWAKPLSSVFHALIDLTPTKFDDGIMLWFTTSDAGQFIAYVVDWVTSIKIIPPKS